MATSYQPAYRAITEGRTDSVRDLIAAEPELPGIAEDLSDWPDSTLLEHAVWWHRREIVDLLVAAGAPGGRPGGTPPQSPLQRALEMGADGLADLLGPGTDLESAAGLGDVSGVRSRLDKADAGAWRRAFRLACLNGRREVARLLCPDGWFDKDALVEALLRGRHLLTWDEGETAWDWARFQLELADPLNVLSFAELPRNDLTRKLRGSEGRRVPPERVWRPMNSPLVEAFLFACQWGQTPRVRAFLADDPELVHSRTMWDAGTLYLPGAYGSTGSVATGLLLLEAGARPYDGIGGPAWWGAVDLVRALLDAGAPTEWRERRESGLLHACAATRYNDDSGHEHWLPIIENLLDKGADPNYADRFGVTPWGFAHDEVRPLLEARGARPEPRHPGLVQLRERLASAAPDVVDRAVADRELLDFYDEQTGCTPALAALVQGDRRLADALLATKGRLDINEAAAFGDVGALEALLDDHGITGSRAGAGPPFVPLHFAAWGGELEVAEVLLARGYSAAVVNRADEAGKYQGMPALRDTTPLHVAADAGQAALLERLLDVWDEHWQSGNG
ncbi:MAG: hypothetical protein OXH15_07320 [Gammaproteobacteria bacterium]|nr:hypothetical protein [Gammaproteobacteria bacterium]